jgi:hypothetical protein
VVGLDIDTLSAIACLTSTACIAAGSVDWSFGDSSGFGTAATLVEQYSE